MRVARRASAIVVAVLCLLLVARTAYALSDGGPGYLFVLASFVLPFGYAVPATRGVWTRHRFWLLAAQAALTYLPFAVFGNHWVGGVSGLLGGLVLLTLAAPGSWLLFAALLVVECVLWMGVVGLPYAPAVHAVVWLCVAFVTTGLAFFGLARLSDVVRELHVARAEFARLAVARERLEATRRLRAALDERLRAVTEHGRAALRALADDRQRAREQMTEAGVLARQVLTDVRAVTADPLPVETPRAARRRRRGAAAGPDRPGRHAVRLLRPGPGLSRVPRRHRDRPGRGRGQRLRDHGPAAASLPAGPGRRPPARLGLDARPSGPAGVRAGPGHRLPRAHLRRLSRRLRPAADSRPMGVG
nr:hypothetical protein GCM10020092_076170 [Actinoplanes digitatis]